MAICLAICVYFEKRKHTGGYPTQSGRASFRNQVKMVRGRKGRTRTDSSRTSGQKEGALGSLLMTTWVRKT